MQNILITGGAGYIGSYFVRKLINLKYNITVIDNLMFNQKAIFLKKKIFKFKFYKWRC